MATEQLDSQETSVTALVSGIVQDARRLLIDQLGLFRVELKNDVGKTMQAFIPLAIGGAILVTGLVLGGIGVAQLLSAELPGLPTWGWYLIIGAAASVVGVICALCGASMASSIEPANAALRELEENVKWTTKK